MGQGIGAAMKSLPPLTASAAMDRERSPFCAATEEPLSTRALHVVGLLLLGGLVMRPLARKG